MNEIEVIKKWYELKSQIEHGTPATVEIVGDEIVIQFTDGMSVSFTSLTEARGYVAGFYDGRDRQTMIDGLIGPDERQVGATQPESAWSESAWSKSEFGEFAYLIEVGEEWHKYHFDGVAACRIALKNFRHPETQVVLKELRELAVNKPVEMKFTTVIKVREQNYQSSRALYEI